jgi:two-component system, NtrC family, nitrogen regulation sensor histidine kinase NtrY
MTALSPESGHIASNAPSLAGNGKLQGQSDNDLPEAPASVKRGERDSISRVLGFLAVIALLVSGTITFLILSGFAPIEPSNEVVFIALSINSVLAAILSFLIGREIWIILQARRKGRAAARLHIRIVGLFALVAAVPAVLVAVVAGITLDLGLDRWFEQRTRQIVGNSISVARAYMDESRRVLTGNTISLAYELDRARQIYSLDPNGFRNLITVQAKGRGFLGAQLLRRDGEVIVSADIEADVDLPEAVEEFFVAADTGDPVSIPPGSTDFIGAMFKLREISNAYLYTIMALRPEVTHALRLMEANTTEYRGLESNRLQFQLAFAVLYIGVCLVVLLCAIWMGISVADRIVAPIRRLITASDEVSSGNLDVQVGTRHTEGDLKNLSDTFNNMTSELRHQRDELLNARDVMDQRARFTEAVLSGVSAAVIGVDSEGVVTIANRAAGPLLNTEDPTDAKLADVAPELNGVFERARSAQKPEIREQVTLWRNGRERTLNVQVTLERESAAATMMHSYVITIDDITDLVVAQRSSAWSDVARRIAHEIKNPLTPIQLSTERIRRRYGKYITEDREIFDQCTDTIIRQVNDIGRMVDEFSSFARMPKPEMAQQDLLHTLGEAVFLQKVGWPDIEFVTDWKAEKMPGMFDARLMSQAFINLIKNAAEAIESKERKSDKKGRILIRAKAENAHYIIDFIDNGKGLPKEHRQRLLEPYMTTREKGTGLGLAIVGKILADHGGRIELLDAPHVNESDTGAMVRVVLPMTGQSGDPEEISMGDRSNTTKQTEIVGS